MSDTLGGEIAESLLSIAREHGYTVERDQLALWHRADLLPRPVRRSLGRGRGMASIYPVGTAKQLVALCEIRDREARFIYEEAMWQLWWAGYSVPIPRIRHFLEQTADDWEGSITDLAEDGALSDQAYVLICGADQARFDSKALRQIRKRTGRSDFSTFSSIMLQVATGTFGGWFDDDDSRIFEKGAGLLRARSDRVAATRPWLDTDSANGLMMLSQTLAKNGPKRALLAIADADLVRARNELRSLIGLFAACLVVSETMFGRGAFGLSGFREIANLRPAMQAGFLLLWLSIRQETAILDGTRILLEQTEPTLKAIEKTQVAFNDLAREVPQLADLLTSQRFGEAAREPQARERLQADLRQYSEVHRNAIDAFIKRHPEHQDVFDSS